MNDRFYKEIKDSTTLTHVAEGLIKVFKEVRTAEKSEKLGYVSGIITSDGNKKIKDNMNRLEKYTIALRNKLSFPVFSGVDVFEDRVYSKLEEREFAREMRQNHFIEFWRKVLRSGHITDIFMTPRWEESEGARDEMDIAKKQKIEIHFINEAFLAYE